jgi:hypothetical protein
MVANVSQDGGAIRNIHIQIQKVNGAFSRLWKIWQKLTFIKAQKLKLLTHV